jgi:hypothetical protein
MPSMLIGNGVKILAGAHCPSGTKINRQISFANVLKGRANQGDNAKTDKQCR